ncbi:MAG TPA: hypothetical protein VIY29_05110 [Ktedonobacteraceae bacterium]
MQFHKKMRRKECPRRADHAQEHSDPGIRLGDSTVMLSTAKQLHAQRERPFATAQGDSEGADDETSQDAALVSLIIHM